MKANAPFVFVLMPFHSDFEDIYKLGIKAVCTELGAYCERVDEQIFEESMLDRIYNQINKADIIIADMSGKNPNVFYETGYAHALNKRVILLTQNSDDIPFDLKHHFHIVYEGKILKLKEDLSKRLNWFISNPTKPLQNVSEFELYVEGFKLNFEETTVITKPYYPRRDFDGKSYIDIGVDVLNTSNKILEPIVKLGVIIDKAEECSVDKYNFAISEKEDLYMVGAIKSTYPSEWKSVGFSLNLLNSEKESIIVTIRTFLEIGIKDFKVQFNCQYGTIWK